MPKDIDFRAFGETEKLAAAVVKAAADDAVLRCGWVPRAELTAPQKAAHDAARAEMPVFTIRGRFSAAERRYALWKAPKQLRGTFLDYNWQQTGSCVGAGGDNAARTGMAVEIALKGESEELRPTFWPYTYGMSRAIAGMRGRGEGSMGSAYAKAITTVGVIEHDPAGLPDLPDFKDAGGWRVQPGSVEMEWSDGGKIDPRFVQLGKTHTFKTAAPIRSADDAFEAIANGYAITIASMFGMRNMVPPVKGTRFPVRVGEWTGQWSHQMFLDECWDHPELNDVIFRDGNNWGPDAHGPATGEEPPGGFYYTRKTLNSILADPDTEAYALSAFDGFPARDLNFSAF